MSQVVLLESLYLLVLDLPVLDPIVLGVVIVVIFVVSFGVIGGRPPETSTH